MWRDIVHRVLFGSALEAVVVRSFNPRTCRRVGVALKEGGFYMGVSPHNVVRYPVARPPKDEVGSVHYRGTPGCREFCGRRPGDYGRGTIPLSDAKILVHIRDFIAEEFFAANPQRSFRHVMGMTEFTCLSENLGVAAAFSLSKASRVGSSLVWRVDPTGSRMHASPYPSAVMDVSQDLAMAIQSFVYQEEVATPGISVGRTMGFTVIVTNSEGQIIPESCFTVYSPTDAGIRHFLLANQGHEGVELVHAYDQASRIAMAKLSLANELLENGMDQKVPPDQLIELQKNVDLAYEALLEVEIELHRNMRQLNQTNDEPSPDNLNSEVLNIDSLALSHQWFEGAVCAATGHFVNRDGRAPYIEFRDDGNYSIKIPTNSGQSQEILMSQEEVFRLIPVAMRCAFGVKAPGLDQNRELSGPLSQAIVTSVITQGKLRGEFPHLRFIQPTAIMVQTLSDQSILSGVNLDKEQSSMRSQL